MKHDGYEFWHHGPFHQSAECGTLMVTGGTLCKHPFFFDPVRLEILEHVLFDAVEALLWQIHAWALLVNHYHLILSSTASSAGLETLINRVHSESSRLLNQLEGEAGRRVWYQYWDTKITYQRSYYPRLNYVNYNPVRHGLVTRAEDYEWCSARWFALNAPSSVRRQIASFKFDQVRVRDDF